MTTKLFLGAITKFLLGVALVGALLFLPAGTFFYFNGWLLMGILFVPMFFAGIVMMFQNPMDGLRTNTGMEMIISQNGAVLFVAVQVENIIFIPPLIQMEV